MASKNAGWARCLSKLALQLHVPPCTCCASPWHIILVPCFDVLQQPYIWSANWFMTNWFWYIRLHTLSCCTTWGRIQVLPLWHIIHLNPALVCYSSHIKCKLIGRSMASHSTTPRQDTNVPSMNGYMDSCMYYKPHINYVVNRMVFDPV